MATDESEGSRGDTTWAGGCRTCGLSVERDSERRVRELMEAHAEYTGHAVEVGRSTGGEPVHEPAGRHRLRCPNPDCSADGGGFYFAMIYDASDDSITFRCKECWTRIHLSDVAAGMEDVKRDVLRATVVSDE